MIIFVGGGLLLLLLYWLFFRKEATKIIFVDEEGKKVERITLNKGQFAIATARLIKSDGSEDTSFENAEFSVSSPEGAVNLGPVEDEPLKVRVFGQRESERDATSGEPIPSIVSFAVDAAVGVPSKPLNNSFEVVVLEADASRVDFQFTEPEDESHPE